MRERLGGVCVSGCQRRHRAAVGLVNKPGHSVPPFPGIDIPKAMCIMHSLMPRQKSTRSRTNEFALIDAFFSAFSVSGKMADKHSKNRSSHGEISIAGHREDTVFQLDLYGQGHSRQMR